MPESRGRTLIEDRFGPLGSGAQSALVDGTDYDMDTLLFRMGLNFEDSRGIDMVAVSEDHFVVRYYDGEDQRVVAHEFDASFRFLGETRAHIAEWVGEDNYYQWFKYFRVRCPADLDLPDE